MREKKNTHLHTSCSVVRTNCVSIRRFNLRLPSDE